MLLQRGCAHSRQIRGDRSSVNALDTGQRLPSGASLQHAIPSWSKLAGNRRMSVKAQAQPSDVLVLDFDGVICNSEPEVSHSGYQSAAKFWPEVFAGHDLHAKLHVLQALARVRSVLVKGYECMVMARLLAEDPGCEGAILADWQGLLQRALRAWGADPELLEAFSNGYRSACFIKDRHAWVHRNQLYSGMYEAMRGCELPWYIASSKAPQRVSPLLASLLGVELPPDSPRLLAGLIPPDARKVDALRTISQRPLVKESGATIHFIDDRFETIKAVHDTADLSTIRLYMADWGYNLPHEREAAAALPGVRLLTLSECCELLKWGVIMGVDDGCEPTEEEVLADISQH